MSYKYDAFLSYRRSSWWSKFVGGTFLDMLTHWLGAELGKKPEIYHDESRMEAGQDWPQELAQAIATSKIIVCLWSTEYFTSEWCREELGHMLARREAVGGKPPAQIIVPAVIHDGESIPLALGSINRVEIQDLASPWLAEGSKKMEELSDKVKLLAKNARKGVEQAPPFDPSWVDLASHEFAALFTAKHGQFVVPSLGGALS